MIRGIDATVCYVMLAACLLCATPGRCEDESQIGNFPARRYLGPDGCIRCHREGKDESQDTLSFVRLDESRIWENEDQHRLAYDLIAESALSAQICEVLEIEDISKERRCLSCHAGWLPDRDEPPRGYVKGVTCESCHGPADDWLNEHYQNSRAWRKLSPQEKHERYGMVDVRNPLRRAELCLSCHIGNAKEGKVVTHAMYAAGHPPLPAVEIETFLQQMPSHWRYLNEKPDFKFREEFVQANFASRKDTPVDPRRYAYRTENVILGAAVALRESVRLFSDMAQGDDWPELAVFDCQACHHALAYPGWRQSRGYEGTPGRPAMHTWPQVLVPLGIYQAGPSRYERNLTALKGHLNEVHDLLQQQPFGDPRKVAQAGVALTRRIDRLVQILARQPYPPSRVKDTLRLLFQLPDDAVLDYRSARQVAWASRVLYAERAANQPQDPRVQQVLERLSGQLKLDLPTIHHGNIVAELPQSLRVIAAYDPAEFRANVHLLTRALGMDVPNDH